MPTTPAGVGERSEIPTELPSSDNASVEINASYPATPSATFSWSSSGSGGITLGNVYNFSTYILPSVTGPFYVGHDFIGLGLRIQLPEIQFGVPIRMLNGTVEVIPSALPSAVPAASLSITVTYVFP